MFIRIWGRACTSNVDQCRPTKFMKTSSNFLMLTSGINPVNRTLGCGGGYKLLTDFEASGLHLVPFGGRCAFCGGLGELAAPVPRCNQSLIREVGHLSWKFT